MAAGSQGGVSRDPLDIGLLDKSDFNSQATLEVVIGPLIAAYDSVLRNKWNGHFTAAIFFEPVRCGLIIRYWLLSSLRTLR